MMFISQKLHIILEKTQLTQHEVIPQSEFFKRKDFNILVFWEENPQSVWDLADFAFFLLDLGTEN